MGFVFYANLFLNEILQFAIKRSKVMLCELLADFAKQVFWNLRGV